MDDLKLTVSSLGYIVQSITGLLTTNPKKVYRVSIKEWREKRSLSQNAFQHQIYTDISNYLISKGRKEWSEKKVKEELKNQFLGWEDKKYTDLYTGEVYTRSTLRHTSDLDVGESCHYTTQILDWAQSIGCEIKIPAKCEYRDLLNKQNT